MESMRDQIIHILHNLYPDPQPSLTHCQSHFQFLVAVLLSGNSTDKIVNQITPTLFQCMPDAQTMSQASVDAIAQLIRPCGLAERKANFLYQLSHQLNQRHQGIPPNDYVSLTALPGVGRKTALVVLNHCYHHNNLPVDTHIARLAQRWHISQKTSPNAIEKDLLRYFGDALHPKLHLQLVYYGRSHCPAIGHSLEQCTICHLLLTSA